MSVDLYDILGVSPRADEATIKRAFRRKARRYHPDRNPDDPQAEDQFKRALAAFEILSDPQRRRSWDRWGAEGVELPAVLRVSDGSDEQDAGTFDNRRPFGRAGASEGAAACSESSRGADVEEPLEVEFLDAVLGREVPFVLDGESVRIPLRAGTRTGERLRVEGRGEPAPGEGGRPGDLVLEVRVGDHPRLSREGLDLSLEMPVTVGEAIRGARIDVPTPHGSVRIEVPPGVDAGARLRVAGHGVRTGEESGDLLAVVQIVTPDRVDEDVEEAAERIDAGYSRDVRGELSM